MSELVVHRSADLRALADGFLGASTGGKDPFAQPLLLVPGAGLGRWLSQYVAHGTGPEGIFAGFDVQPLASLETLLDPDAARDPWRPDRLVWRILEVLDSDDPVLAPVRHHLTRNDQRYANAHRLARLFLHYCDHRPTLVAGWTTNSGPDNVGADDVWQPHLWRWLHTLIGDPDPIERRATCIERLTGAETELPWPSVHAFAPRRIRPHDTHLVRALAAQVMVHVWLPSDGPEPTTHPLGAPLARRARAWHHAWQTVASRTEDLTAPPPPATALGRLQAGIRTGTPTPVGQDPSIAIHASHGPARQVGVLREALTGAFADDPTLEPRHVVIACPEPALLAPHLDAAFTPARVPSADHRAHPATTFRLQIAQTSAAQTNRVYALLADLLRLGTGRATSNDLLALAQHPFVARRFGFDADALERLEELLDAAGVRWGVDQAHRSRFGLDNVPQSTWQLGVRRLLLGEAFSADRPTSVGAVATVDDVTSTDATVIGALAELVSRVSRIVADFTTPRGLAAWAERLRHTTEVLLEVPFTDLWQLNQVWSVLDELAGRAEASTTALGPADAAALLDRAFEHRTTRPNFGNGSLVVCSLEALARVPHRVVCLVGLDEQTFPRRTVPDGDDLLADQVADLDPDPGADDRQLILDAVLSATERLIVVYQGFSTHLNTEHNPPAGVLELVELAGQRAEPLQPFSPANFLTPPRSFDTAALTAARALAGEHRQVADRWQVGFVPRTEDLTTLDLGSLVSFVRHPGAFWLRQRTGITLTDEEPSAQELPLELGALDEWALGNRILAALNEGQPAEPLITSEWLSGDVPPLLLGRRAMERVRTTADRLHRAWRTAAAPEVVPTLVSLDVAGVRITGSLTTRGDRLVEAHYARISPRHLGAAWVQVLAATVMTGRRTDAVLIGRGGTERLSAPPVDIANALLTTVVGLAVDGTTEILPMPPRLAHRWARLRARGEDPLADTRGLKQAWDRDHDQVWKRCLPGRRPGARARTEDGRFGHPEETPPWGALATSVWGPLGRGPGT
ncbi:MAG: exodeoxyribonuclease V subunit gamma [Propioniciclava sp.]